jgi:hypothetical protein
VTPPLGRWRLAMAGPAPPGRAETTTADGAGRWERHAGLFLGTSVRLLVFAPAAPVDWSRSIGPGGAHPQGREPDCPSRCARPILVRAGPAGATHGSVAELDRGLVFLVRTRSRPAWRRRSCLHPATRWSCTMPPAAAQLDTESTLRRGGPLTFPTLDAPGRPHPASGLARFGRLSVCSRSSAARRSAAAWKCA